ncbi:MAG: PCRF domain-containing protein, partial [Bacteroidota bacterium]
MQEKEKHTQDPEFWNDPKKAELVMKEIRNLKVWTNSFDQCHTALEDLKVLHEFFKEGDVEEQELQSQYDKAVQSMEELEFKNMLSAQQDTLNAVMQITAGAGGTESCDWA